MKTRIILISIAAALSGCGEEVEPKSLVDDLTILAVRADPPETAPGGTVTLDALVADPAGAGRPVELSWFLCAVDPTVGTSSCVEEANLTPIGVGGSIAVAVTADALEQVPAELRARGIDVFVAMKARAGDEESNVAIKRVRISESATPNANPSLETFDLEGVATVASNGAFLVEPGSEIEIYARVADGSHQEYVDDAGGSRVEEMRFAWFLTAGLFENDITWEDEEGAARTTWTAPADGTTATLWVVLRDGRGGVDWRTLVVETDESA